MNESRGYSHVLGDPDLGHLLDCLDSMDVPQNRLVVVKALTELCEIKQYNEIQRRNTTLQAIITKQQKDLGAMASALNRVQNEHSFLESKLFIKQQTINELQEKIAEMSFSREEDLSRVHEEYKAKLQEMDKEAKTHEELLNLNAVHQEMLAELEEEYKEELGKVKDEHREELTQLQDSHKKELKNKKEGHKSELKRIKDENADLSNELKKINDANGQLSTENEILIKGYCNATGKVQELEKQLDDGTRTHIRQVSEIDKLYKKERAINEDLQFELEELRTFRKTYEDVLQDANRRNEQLRKEHSTTVNSLNEQMEKLQSTLAGRKEEVDNLNRRIVELTDEKRSLQNTIGHNKDHIQKLTDSLAKQKEKCVALSGPQLDVEKVKRALKEQFMEMSREWITKIRSMEQIALKSHTELMQFRKALQDKIREFSDTFQASIRVSEENCAQLEKKCSVQKTFIETLRGQGRVTLDKNYEYQKTIDSLNQTIVNLNQTIAKQKQYIQALHAALAIYNEMPSENAVPEL